MPTQIQKISSGGPDMFFFLLFFFWGGGAHQRISKRAHTGLRTRTSYGNQKPLVNFYGNRVQTPVPSLDLPTNVMGWPEF